MFISKERVYLRRYKYLTHLKLNNFTEGVNWEGDLTCTLSRFENVKRLAKILKGVLKSDVLFSLKYIFIHTHSETSLRFILEILNHWQTFCLLVLKLK